VTLDEVFGEEVELAAGDGDGERLGGSAVFAFHAGLEDIVGEENEVIDFRHQWGRG
jgi:hypothetical protein